MSKTVKILCLVSFALVAIAVALGDIGPKFDIGLLPEPEKTSSHGGFTISGYPPGHFEIFDKWRRIVEGALIAAVAFAIAAARVWYQDRKEKNETLKEHLEHSRIINIEGKR